MEIFCEISCFLSSFQCVLAPEKRQRLTHCIFLVIGQLACITGGGGGGCGGCEAKCWWWRVNTGELGRSFAARFLWLSWYCLALASRAWQYSTSYSMQAIGQQDIKTLKKWNSITHYTKKLCIHLKRLPLLYSLSTTNILPRTPPPPPPRQLRRLADQSPRRCSVLIAASFQEQEHIEMSWENKKSHRKSPNDEERLILNNCSSRHPPVWESYRFMLLDLCWQGTHWYQHFADEFYPG